MKNIVHISCITLLLTGGAFAAEDDLGFSGSGQLGYVAARGNSETETLQIGAKLVYNTETWRYSGSLNSINASENDIDTTDRAELGLKADYKFSDVSYFFGSLRYEDD